MKKETNAKITPMYVKNRIKQEMFLFSIQLKTLDKQYLRYTFSCEDGIESVSDIPDEIINQLVELATEVSNTTLEVLLKTCPVELPEDYTLNHLVSVPAQITKVSELALGEFIYTGDMLSQTGLIVPEEECGEDGNILSPEDALMKAMQNSCFDVVFPIQIGIGEVPITETYYISLGTGLFICYKNDDKYRVPKTSEEAIAMNEHILPQAGYLNPIQIATIFLRSIKSQVAYQAIYGQPLIDMCPNNKVLVDALIDSDLQNVPRGTEEDNE